MNSCRYSDARAWRAYMGMRVMNSASNAAATRQIRRIVQHAQYDQFTSDYDIALLELSAPVFFNDLVQPVCVPAPSHAFTSGTNCFVTGWGVLTEEGKASFCAIHHLVDFRLQFQLCHPVVSKCTLSFWDLVMIYCFR